MLNATQKGQLIFNKNLNDIFQAYGCVNNQDAYQQIFTQTNNLVKDYCQLTLNDLQMVNIQIGQWINNISNDRKSTSYFVQLIENNLSYCSATMKPQLGSHHQKQGKSTVL
jgi:phosphate-selective porin